MIVAGAQTLGNTDALQTAPWPLLDAGSAAPSVNFVVDFAQSAFPPETGRAAVRAVRRESGGRMASEGG